MTKIQFGTSGWRGIMCEDFILDNVRTVTQAIADHLNMLGTAKQGVVIGYDARFMGENFAEESAKILAGAGIPTFLCDRDTPTPVIAFEILRRKAAGGINFTASHNPAQYNGLKFSPASGGPALPETTRDIEQRANEMLGEICYREIEREPAEAQGLITTIDPREDYCRRLREMIDFSALRDRGWTMAINPLYGTARGYLDRVLEEEGVRVVTINHHRDPYFGGFPPEPAEENIHDFRSLVKGESTIALGLATDGDADRYGILDRGGSYIEPNYILALLYDYLLRVKKEKGPAARSVATSHFIDAVARYHGEKVFETPVGFKFIGDYISKGVILIGGEESAGLTIRGHVPDKDGILACLLVAEMVAVEGKTLQQLLAELYERVGTFRTRRINLKLSSEVAAGIGARLADPPKSVAGRRVLDVITIDGTKLLLEGGGWVLFRKSGTEPVVRIYAEASDDATLNELIEGARALITG